MRLLLILFISIVFSSCEYLDNLNESSDQITREFNHEPVKYIIIEAPCQIELQPDFSEKIYVDGYEHVISGVQLNFMNDSLVINHENKNYLQKSKLPVLRISASNLNRIVAFAPVQLETTETLFVSRLAITINGIATFSSANLSVDCSYFALHVYGTGNIGDYYVDGNSTETSLLLEGRVGINAQSLNSQRVKVVHKSIENCLVDSEESLKVNTYSTGNTLYTGNPVVEHEHIIVPYFSSTGDVIKLD